MPSPFPGMDPYIEAYGDWLDFHGRLITYCCDLLNDRLPEGYAASLDTQLKLVHAEEDVVEGRMRPDLGVHRDPRGSATPARGVGVGVATLEARTLTLPVDYDEIRESAVQIIHYPERRLVTHIELLSPTNKRNPGRGEYLAKRVALIHQQKVNMVEIDLLLGGERLETVEPLPEIPIPLLPPDADVTIDLAVLVNQVYDRGRYRHLLAYDRPSPKALAAPEGAWAAEVAAAARR